MVTTGPSLEDGKSEHDDAAFRWFCKFLEAKFHAVQSSHFVPCSSQVSTEKVLNQTLDLCVMYNLIALVAFMVASQADFTLHGLVQELLHQKILKSGDDDHQGLLYQLVFMSVGWLSMLYDPEVEPSKNRLQIKKDTSGVRKRLRASKIRKFDQDFGQTKQPFRRLLRVFGDIVPQVGLSDHGAGQNLKNSEFLSVGYLSYHTLSQVGNVKIEWVDSHNCHLDFVEERRTLKLFRFPSFCHMIFCAESEDPFLCR